MGHHIRQEMKIDQTHGPSNPPALRFHEVAEALGKLAGQFADVTDKFEQIIKEAGAISASPNIPEQGVRFDKYAAAAAIVSTNWMELLAGADVNEEAISQKIKVAVQLGKIGDKRKIALPGGAVLSDQEIDWINKNPDKTAPPNLFYALLQDYLVRGEDPKFTYNEIKAGQSFTALLKSNLIRELGEELGAKAAEMLQFQAFLPSWRETTLTSVTLPDADCVAQQIADHFADRGVIIGDKKSLRGIYTTVKERVAVVFTDILERLEQLATDNVESKGVMARSIGWLLEVGKKTTESVETCKNFQEKYPHYVYGAYDGARNPSTTWGLGLLLGWFKDQVIKSDPYKDGGLRSEESVVSLPPPPPEVK